jgi:hypothetical protein
MSGAITCDLLCRTHRLLGFCALPQRGPRLAA